MDFSHVVLTVFNVRLHFGGNASPSGAWLANRFDLFEDFCLPSMRSQSNQNFKWLVLFDSGTPDSFREKIESYTSWENFVPCFVDQVMTVESFAQMKRDLITKHIADQTRFLITTTLDNDDAVGVHYVEIVQNQFCGQQFEFVNLPRGFVLDHTKGKLYEKRDESNPFISLIESIEDFKTVWCGPHPTLSSFGKIRQVHTEPMWLQVIHGRNVLNNVGMRRRIPIRLLGCNFSIRYRYDPSSENEAALIFENVLNKIRYLTTLPLRP